VARLPSTADERSMALGQAEPMNLV
jgi:hypothetical protein